jgi:hypothetical protein
VFITLLAGVYTGRVFNGEKPGEPRGDAANQVRTGHQSPDCQGARPDRARKAAALADKVTIR